MSQQERKGPYVYQPYGTAVPADKVYAKAGRLYGVSGISPCTRIDGLTREEAEAIVDALKLLAYRRGEA